MQATITHGESTVVKVIGRLDTVTSAELDEKLKNEAVTEDKMIIDFTGVEYISSAGLRLLLSLKNRLGEEGKQLEIHNINAVVKEIFTVTGFINALTVK
ncbi:MAG: STAS domain-containing protein [Clostridia bacterium]|nr:STAS domain-containing protein [Clostridia bacterium]